MNNALVDISMLVFVVASLFGTGLALTIEEILQPIRRGKTVFLALFVNFFLIPGLTYASTLFLKLESSLFAGLMLLACCAGAPFLPALAGMAGGSIAFGVGLMVVLMVATVFYAPLVIPLAIPGVAVHPWSIASPLIFYMLLPLIVGLVIKAIKPDVANFIRPLAKKISLISLVIMGGLALFMAFPSFVRAYGTGVYNANLVFLLGSVLIGYFFSGLKNHDKFIMALGAGQRNIMAALLVAAANFPDRNVLTVILIGSLVSFIILFSAAGIFGRFVQRDV